MQANYSEINISGKQKGFDGVLLNLWPLANAGFRRSVLVSAWTADNRWRPAVCSGQALMLFERAAKFDAGAHGARCAGS